MAASPTLNEDVFAANLKGRTEYKDIVDMVSRSPYLVGMLNEFQAKGGRVELGAPGSGGYFLGPDVISLDPNWVQQFAATPNELKKFVSLIGHEVGHATRPNGSGGFNEHPWEESRRGLQGEGVALTSEYIVAKQLGGKMWSDPAGTDVRAALDGHATAAGVDPTKRLVTDTSAAWTNFDQASVSEGASYYAKLPPSTAPNLKYDEYYMYFRGLANVMGADVDKIDWQQLKSADVTMTLNPDRSYTVKGTNLPMLDGSKRTVEGQFSAQSELMSSPAKAGTPSADERAGKNGLGPAAKEVLVRTSPLYSQARALLDRQYGREFSLEQIDLASGALAAAASQARMQGIHHLTRTDDGGTSFLAVEGTPGSVRSKMATVDVDVAVAAPIDRSNDAFLAGQVQIQRAQGAHQIDQALQRAQPAIFQY